MYAPAEASSFHGTIAIPTNPVINPPVLNEISLGARLAKSFAGLTTLAAMFTETVATPTPKSAITATSTRTPPDAITGPATPGRAPGEVDSPTLSTGSRSPPAGTPDSIA